MRIQTFKNMKGIIYGDDPKRIGCDKVGLLKIGPSEINVSADKDEILPLLFHGCTGDYDATFTDSDGQVYDLGKVAVRSGHVAAPDAVAAELMELRCRVDEAETLCETLRKEVEELSKIFDLDALNFLIK